MRASLLLVFWATAATRLGWTSRTDADVMAIFSAFAKAFNRPMTVTGWANVLDFCVTFPAGVIFTVEHIA